MSSKSVSKVTPGKLANMALASIKTLGFYGFQVCVIVADGANEKNTFLKELQHSILHHTFQFI